MLAYSRGAQGRVHVTRCIRPKMGMGPTESSEPPQNPGGPSLRTWALLWLGLPLLNVSLFIWTVDFGAQGPEIPCTAWQVNGCTQCQASKHTPSCQGHPVWAGRGVAQEGSLGPFPHCFLNFMCRLGKEWHPVVSKGGPPF